MSREQMFSLQNRSRSRSFSAYRYNKSSRRDRSSPGPPAKYRKRSESPLLNAMRQRYSLSHSPVPKARNGHRSPSPMNKIDRRRRSGSGVPDPSPVLGVFGLHVRTSEGEIRDIFERFGSCTVHMVYDAKSQGFRGYCFIYYLKTRDATTALQETNGMEIRDRRIRVDYSKTKRAHTPTPGFYRGKRGQRNRSFDRQRPPRRDMLSDRGSRREEPPRRREPMRHRSRERMPVRDFDRDREMRQRSDVRRRSPMDRGMNRRSPRRESFRGRRDRS